MRAIQKHLGIEKRGIYECFHQPHSTSSTISLSVSASLDRSANALGHLGNDGDCRRPTGDFFSLRCSVARQTVCSVEELLGQRFKPGKRFLFIDFESVWKNRGFNGNLKGSCQRI
jgi:hypothetical protein